MHELPYAELTSAAPDEPFPGEKGDKVSRKSPHNGGVYWKHKGNTGYLTNRDTTASELPNGSLTQWKELGYQDPRLRLPQCPDTRPLPALPSMLLVLDKELRSFSIHQGFWKSLASAQPSIKKRLEIFSD